MSNLAEQMAADALEAQKLSRKYFVLELNFSEASVQELERQFDAIDYSLKGGRSPENLLLLRRTWGSYLGEVLRRKLGGEWTTVGEGPTERIALRCPAGDLFPHDQVARRLGGDASANVWEYVQAQRAS